MENAQEPLRTLSVLADPTDLPQFYADFLWQQTVEVLGPFRRDGLLQYERLQPASTNALRDALPRGPWHVFHFVVHSKQRIAARYATISLVASDGRSGDLTAQALANLLASCKGLALAIFQSADDGAPCFDLVAEELVSRNLCTVVTAPKLRERSQAVLLAKVYSAVVSGLSGSQLANELAAARSAPGIESVRVLGSNLRQPIWTRPGAPVRVQTVIQPVPTPSPLYAEPPPAWKEILRRKRAADAFDVFLCHNSEDKPAIRRLYQQLEQEGILPWLDEEDLPPGQMWQPLLEQQIKTIRSAAVFIGSAGFGPWHRQEMYAFLSAFVRRGTPVIPVLLPDAPSAPELPVFLTGMTWVDFRSQHTNPLRQLIWGITGKRPD